MNTNNTKTTSYGVIIFWIIIFWPYGTYLLVKNLQNSKAAVINGSNAPRNVAVALFGLAVILLVSLPISSGDPETKDAAGILIAVSIGMAIGGVYLLKVFNDTRNLAVEFKKYLNAVVNGKLTKIEDIANATGVTTDIAEHKLQRMIDLDIFKGAYIDHTSGELILGEKVISPDVEYVGVVCPNCGAENSVAKGSRGICKYCDSAL